MSRRHIDMRSEGRREGVAETGNDFLFTLRARQLDQGDPRAFKRCSFRQVAKARVVFQGMTGSLNLKHRHRKAAAIEYRYIGSLELIAANAFWSVVSSNSPRGYRAAQRRPAAQALPST